MSRHRANARTRQRIGSLTSRLGDGRRPPQLLRNGVAIGLGLPSALGAVTVSAAAAGAVTTTTPTVDARVSVAVRSVASDDRQASLSRGIVRDATTKSHAMLDERTAAQAQRRQDTLNSLAKTARRASNAIKARNKWVLPTTNYRLTGRFGQASGLWASNHTGLDFATDLGTPIVAVAGGKIIETGWAGSFGNRTIELLPDGTELWYAHQLKTTAQPGQVVRAGEQIGEVGSTGNSTGSHVHLEVRPGGGSPIDPMTALVYHGLRP